MTSTQTSFMNTITKHLPMIEKVLLITLAIGLILTVVKIDSMVTTVALFGLCFTFFLYAYQPAKIIGQGDEQVGFSELLALAIIPKVLWISLAITTLGIAFYIVDMGNERYKQMLLIGGITIGFAIVLLVGFLVTGVKHINTVTPILLRAVPLFIVAMYILFK